MLVCMDVDYRAGGAVTACVGFERWSSDGALFETTHVRAELAANYQAGEFYRRELPCLLDALAALPETPEVVVVDGYVWLADGKQGLGAHLHTALGGGVPVVGVAKNEFRTADRALEVTRGTSARPLYVSAVGIDAAKAAAGVRSMAGDHRIPTLLKRADRLARDAPR
jgi:deoxyribonuclease V